MERSSNEIQLDLKAVEETIFYHKVRLSHFNRRQTRLTMELNRARRLEREAKGLQS